MRKLFFPLAVGALFMALPEMALAAPSFDCAKASTVVEKTICSDATLGDLDQKLAGRYRSVLSQLSSEGQARVQEGQRQWLKYVGTVCDITLLPKDRQPVSAKPCIQGQYRIRQEQLDAAVVVKGGKTFYYVQIFKAHRTPDPNDETGSPSGFVTLASSYPQLDNSKSPSEKLLNTTLRFKGRYDVKNFTPDNDRDSSVDIKLSTVLPALMSFDVRTVGYGHGAPHANGWLFSYHWLLSEGRELRARDIFSTQSKWQAFLRKECFDEVKDFGVVEKPTDLGEPVQPASWSFSKNGLTITFQPYNVASRAEGMPKVTISWDKLKPYLVDNASTVLAGVN